MSKDTTGKDSNSKEMKDGNWVPLDGALVRALPTIRPYTLIEAAFSYQKDLRDGTVRCYRDYARIWSWTKNKAIGFIRDKQGTKTEQAKDTQGTVKFRWVKPSRESKGQARDEQGTKPGQARDTTNKIDRKNKKNYSDAFLLFWKAYPRKENKVDDKSDAYNEWTELNPSDSLTETILAAVEKYKRSESWKELKGRFIPNAAKWLRNRKWEDEPTDKPLPFNHPDWEPPRIGDGMKQI